MKLLDDGFVEISNLLTESAVSILGQTKQCDRYLSFLQSGHKSTRNDKFVSKQSLYKSVVRAEHTVLAGLPYLVAIQGSREQLDAFFSCELGRRGILSGAVIRKCDWLSQSVLRHSDAEWDALKPKFEQLWDSVVQRMADHHASVGLLSHHDRVQVYFYTLFFIARLYGDAFSSIWADTWQLAQKKGMLENPNNHRQLATLGAYVGEPGAQVDFLAEEGNRSLEVALLLMFASGGSRSNLAGPELYAGDPQVLYKKIRQTRLYGEKSVREMLSYCSTCLHSQIYRHESLILMVFVWLRWICTESVRLNIAHKLHGGFLKILHVLEINKSRLRAGYHSARAYTQSLNLLHGIVSIPQTIPA